MRRLRAVADSHTYYPPLEGGSASLRSDGTLNRREPGRGDVGAAAVSKSPRPEKSEEDFSTRPQGAGSNRKASRFFSLYTAAFCVALAPQVPRADSGIFGVWATQKNNGRVVIEPCGSAICGRVIDGNQIRANPAQTDVNNPDPAKRTRRVKGLVILEGYSGGPSQWRGGSVYDPQNGDETNNSTLTLVSPDTLKVAGCRLIFCRSETWTRAN